MPDPKPEAERQQQRSVGPEEGGHRVTSPGAADAGKAKTSEQPDYDATIRDADIPSGAEETLTPRRSTV